MSFLDLAEKRFSVRQFNGVKVEQAKIEQILRAGQVAPTACNNQPQKIYVMNGEDSLARLKKCTQCHFNAPLALLVCSDTSICWKRPFDGKSSADVDASIVTTHMMLEAAELGIGSTWVMFFEPDKIKAEFNLPENCEPISLLVMGYAAKDAQPSPRHGSVKPLSETVTFLD